MKRALAGMMLLAAGLTGPAAVAHAQASSGRSGMSTSDPLNNVNAFAELSFFGRCIVSAHRDRAFALLATTAGSAAESDYLRTLLQSNLNCLPYGSRTSASNVYYRGVVAEALVAQAGAMPAALALGPIGAADVRSLSDVGRCYVSDHREAAMALLATRLGSAEELAAVTALWPHVQACMARSARVRLNAQWIRFLVAEAVLRVPQPARAVAGN